MIVPAGTAALVAGFGFDLSLIVVMGAQNVYVLRQGLRREHVLAVVALCAVSDAALIGAGVAGAGAAFAGRPGLLHVVRAVGAAFLFGYAVLAARRAARPTGATADAGRTATSVAAAVGACLAFTWLNPSVYLDTVVLLGSVSQTRPGQQWWFGGGAALASLLWFVALGFGAHLLGPVFRRPGAWRVLDAGVAAVMVATGIRVVLGG